CGITQMDTYVSLFFFFFFQAEDGIRDLTVTGVQTCALPISPLPRAHSRLLKSMLRFFLRSDLVVREARASKGKPEFGLAGADHRSEERRVGKECRSRWSRDH